MIARTWRGWTAAEDADRYAAYVARTGLAAYESTPGNVNAQVLYRVDGDRAEFLVLSIWTSMDAIHAFAGPDVDRAVFYPEDDEFLIERESFALHWGIKTTGSAAPDSPEA